MKARIEDNKIVVYSQLPSQYKSDTLGLVLAGFNTLDPTIHYAEGFRDVIIPVYDIKTQHLADIYYDDVNDIFSYTVETNVIPVLPVRYQNILTPLEFLNRFTDDELISIITLSKTNIQVELWWIKYNKAQDMNLDDPQTIQGVQALEAVGLIAEGRATEILTKYPINPLN